MSRPRQPPRQFPRVARVNEAVLEVLASELDRLSDPRLGFATITSVEVAKDLRFADVYYTVLGTDAQRAETTAGLASAAPHLRALVGRSVRMKWVPELRFHEDPSVATGERIEAIIRDLQESEQRADTRRNRRNRTGDAP